MLSQPTTRNPWETSIHLNRVSIVPAPPVEDLLGPERGLIFRITHRRNVPWLLRNGVTSSDSKLKDPGFVRIGNEELITKRAGREVPVAPGGRLSEYVPFYFTPCSPMLYNILTGRGVPKRTREEIVVLVSSLPKLAAEGLRWVITDRHAYLKAAQFSNNLEDLRRIDWDLLRNQDFQRDSEDPTKLERYQAEALVHEGLPPHCLLGIGCYTEEVRSELDAEVRSADLQLHVVERKAWYLERKVGSF